MNPFKIGDIIVCVLAQGNGNTLGNTRLHNGQEYEVEKLNDSDVYLKDTKGGSYNHERFKLKGSTMQVDVKKLAAAIDGMSSICATGRKEIKTVLAEGFGIVFETPQVSKPKPKVQGGQIWKHKDNNGLYLVQGFGNNVLVALDDYANRWDDNKTFGTSPNDFDYVGMFNDVFKRT